MQRIGKNIFSLGASRIISGLILFFVYIRLVVYLGPDDFGRFSLVLAFYTIFLLFVDLGVSRHVIKKVSADQTLANKYLGNFLVAQFFIAGLIFVLFLLLPKLLGYEQLIAESMLLAGIGLFFAAMSIPFASILQAWQKIHLVAGVLFLNTLINAGWLALVILRGQNLVFIFWIYIIIGLVDIVIYLWLTKRVSLKRVSLEKGLVKGMFLAGLPFAFISGFEILIQKIDVVIQKVFLPFSEVGFYSSAYRFLDFLTFLPAVVAISLFPYFSGKADLNESDSLQTINNLNRYMWALALPLGVFASILGREIILSLFDERYLAAVLPFQILIWSTALTLVYAVPNVMMIVKQTKRAFVVLLGVVVLNVVLNFVLVPRYGIIASAWITVGSYIVTAGFYIFFTKQFVSYKLFQYAWWPLVASGVSGIVLTRLSSVNFVLSGLIASVIYFAILFGFGFLKKNDLLFLRSVFSKEQ